MKCRNCDHDESQHTKVQNKWDTDRCNQVADCLCRSFEPNVTPEFPLYPHLSEAGAKEAERVIQYAKKRLKEVCDEALGEIYCDIPSYVGGDSWTNFRNAVMDGYQNYGNRKIQGDYDFRRIREKIFAEFRDEIVKDLDQDNVERIKELEKRCGELQERLNEAYRRYP